MNDEMMKALQADGEKLKALTDVDHGPIFLDGDPVFLETPPPAAADMPDHEVRETGETTDG